MRSWGDLDESCAVRNTQGRDYLGQRIPDDEVPSDFQHKIGAVDANKQRAEERVLQLLSHLEHTFHLEDIAFGGGVQDKRVVAERKPWSLA